jgi:predicted ATPase
MHESATGSRLTFPDLSIEGFRGFKDFSVSHLGRVTLITGRNNTGKSSILEALRIHTQNADPSVMREALAFREEYSSHAHEPESPSDYGSSFPISALFHGFPEISDDFTPIIISTSGKTRRMELSMRVGWFTYERDSDGNRREVSRQDVHSEESEVYAALVVETEEAALRHQIDERFFERKHHRTSARMPCILVHSYGSGRTDELGQLWDQITLTDLEEHVVDALRIIDTQITAVSMVVGEGHSHARTAMVRGSNLPRPVPLRSLGDGLNRLFAMTLSLVNARGGLLLLDEFENGLHHTVQLDAWRMIFQLAQSLDVQVFATSHSEDAVRTFQRAAAEAPEEGSLLRLTRRDDDIIPTMLAENELAIATRDKIEVR